MNVMFPRNVPDIMADISPERLKISNWNLESNFTPENFLNGADIDFHLSDEMPGKVNFHRKRSACDIQDFFFIVEISMSAHFLYDHRVQSNCTTDVSNFIYCSKNVIDKGRLRLFITPSIDRMLNFVKIFMFKFFLLC